MLVIAGTLKLDPAKFEAARAAALEIMAETHKEPGNISYVFTQSLDEPGTIHIFEEWESEEALKAHFTAPHMAAFQAKVPEFGVKDMKVQKYEVSSVGPVR
jgi:quinol monooxygenase YgiN